MTGQSLDNARSTVQSVVAQYLQADAFSNPNAVLSVSQIFEQQSRDDSKTQIDLLEALRDSFSGIMHHSDSAQPVLIRDARNASALGLDNDTQRKIANISKLIHIVDTSAAVKDAFIMESIDTSNVSEEFNELLQQAVNNYENNQDIDLSFYDRKMTEIAQFNGISDASKKIKDGLNFRNLANNQRHIVTITSHKDSNNNAHVAVEADVMMIGLTEQQRSDYQAIKEREKVIPSWYERLPQHQQNLVRHYIDELLEGRVVPTQLKSILPGLRNAHSKEIYLTDQGGALTFIAQSVHMGALSFHGPGTYEEKLEVAQENVKQLQEFFPEGAAVSDINLTSPVNVLDVEPEILRELSDIAAENKQFSQSTTPLNVLRYISRNYTDGYNEVFNKISDAFVDNVPQSIKEFIGNGKGSKNAVRRDLEKSNLLSGDEKNVITAIIDARILLDKRWFVADQDNRNLQLAASMKAIVSQIHLRRGSNASLFDAKKLKAVPHFTSHCKSGKDRDGALETEFSGLVLHKELQLDKKEVLQSLVIGGHTQFMASANGGFRGAHGIKGASKTALPSYYEGFQDQLVLKSADNNKLFYKDKGKGLFNRIVDLIEKIFEGLKNSFRFQAKSGDVNYEPLEEKKEQNVFRPKNLQQEVINAASSVMETSVKKGGWGKYVEQNFQNVNKGSGRRSSR